MQMEFDDGLSAAPEQENLYDEYELYVALSSYDGRSLTVWKKAPGGMEERIQLRAPSKQMGRRIAFYEDDLIQITESSSSFGGWWKGSLNGAAGIFPSCLLEALDTTLPTLDTLEDTMASMDSLLANMSASSSVMSSMMNITPRSGEREIERLANRLEHVADTTVVPDVEEVERMAPIAPADMSAEEEDAPDERDGGGRTSSSSVEELQVDEKREEELQQVDEKREEESSPMPARGEAIVVRSNSQGRRVVRPASLKISKGDGTVVMRALSPPLGQTPLKKAALNPTQPTPATSVRAIRTIKVVKAANAPSVSPQRMRPMRASVPIPEGRIRAASSGVRVVRGATRTPVVVRNVSARNSMTEVVVTGSSPKSARPASMLSPRKAAGPLSPRKVAGPLSPRKKAAAPPSLRKKAATPLSPREPTPVEEDVPLAPPPEMGLRSRAGLEEDCPLGPPPDDLPLPPPGQDVQSVTDARAGLAAGEDGEGGSSANEEEEEELDLDDLPDVERTIRQPEEPAPLPPAHDGFEVESPRFLADAVPLVQKSPRRNSFSLDLTAVTERTKSVREDVFKPITPGTRARLHSLPKPAEPAPKCPFQYDPYEDSYAEEGDDNFDHFNDSSDGVTPRGNEQKAAVQVVDPKAAATSSEGRVLAVSEGEPPVQLRAKTKKRLHQKAQRKQAKGAHQLSRAASAPYVKEPTEAMKAVAMAPPAELAAVPKRAYSSMKAEDVAAVSTEGVQLRPRVKKALGAKKKKRVPGQQRAPAVVKETSPEQQQAGAPKTAAEMRRFNFYEVVATERSYVKAMQQLVQVMAGLLEIQRKLTEAGDTGATLPAELQTLHVSATIILGYSRKTLEMMLPRQQNYNDQTCIGDIFLLIADFLKIYTQYVRGYEPFVNKFLIARQKNKVLREQVEKYEMSVGSFITFESHLIVPVQRIPRYSLLLKDMLRNTHEEHPDYHLLAEAVRKIERVADFVNARQTVYENLNKVIELEKKYGKQLTEQTGISQFVRSHRRVIKEATLLLCAGDSKPRRVQVSLLNDLLVVGTQARQAIMNWGGCKLLNVVCLWLVDHKNVTDVAGRQHCFELVMEATSESVLVLKCGSEEEKRDWMEELSAVKKMLNKAINVGAKTAEQKKRISIALNVKWTSPVIPQEIAMALAEEQAQRRQQANIQMMPIAQPNADYAKITELPSEITNALRRESNKKSGRRAGGRRRSAHSSGESGDDQEQGEYSSRDSVRRGMEAPERPKSPGTSSAERARSPVSTRTKKSKSAAKGLRKTLSPLSRHLDGSGKSGGGRRSATLRGRERAAAAAATEEREEKGSTSPRGPKIPKESVASPWSPKMLKLRLGKSNDGKVEKKKEKEKRKEEKEGRKKEEKEERKKERKSKEVAKPTLDPTALAPAHLKSSISPRSERVTNLSKKGSGKKRAAHSGRGKGHNRSNSVECFPEKAAPALDRRSVAGKRRTRRSASMSDVSDRGRVTATMFSTSTGAVTAAAASNASRKGTMRRRGKSKDKDKKQKKKRPRAEVAVQPRSLNQSG